MIFKDGCFLLVGGFRMVFAVILKYIYSTIELGIGVINCFERLSFDC